MFYIRKFTYLYIIIIIKFVRHFGPATLTLSKKLFSDARNFLTAKGTRLNPKLFNRLIFLKKNALFIKSIHFFKKFDM